MHVTRRLWMRVAMMAFLVLALVPAAPTAAAAAITFNLAIGDRCVYGTKPAGGTLTVTLVAPNGIQRDKRKDASGEPTWSVCFRVSTRPGDRIRAVRGSVRRTITVPTVTATLDRVTDVLSGRAPAGRTLTIRAQHCSLSGDCDPLVSRTATADARGRYRKDLTSGVDIRGADVAIVSYQTSAGDLFGRYTFAPFVVVGGPGKVTVMCAGTAERRVILRRADGTERARATFPRPQRCDTDLFARLDKRFTRRGRTLSPGVGNTIRSDIASDARFTWRGMSLALVGGSFEGRCFPNAGFTVALLSVDGGLNVFDRIVTGTTATDGTFAEAIKPGTQIELDDRVRLVCETPRGDRGVIETHLEFQS